MKRIKKGNYGYLKSQKTIEIFKTLFCLILSVAIYRIGIYSTGSNKNLLTLVAVLGCLPMAKFAVNAIMFIKAKGCSLEVKEKIETKGLKPVFYDLFFTTFKKNFQISALDYKKKCLIMLTEDPDIELQAAEDHIKDVLNNCGYSSVTVKIYTDSDKFIERMAELKELSEENKDLTYLFDNILNVSL